jgi:CO/xanthine dehydrogenase FAD-binding subunit
MKPAPFEYLAPDSIEQALDLKRQHGDEARILAGGQSLVPAMNFRVVQPGVLIDLNRARELDYIREDGKALRVGSMTRERSLEFDPLIAKRIPLMAEGILHVAHPQIRNRGTFGGSLAHADPAAELPVLAIALDARMKVSSAGAERWLAAQDFFAGMFTTALAADEILVEIEIPFMAPLAGFSFTEVAPRVGDYALMGVAVLVELDKKGKCQRAKLIYLNAGDGPLNARESARLLEGQSMDDKTMDAAAAHASEKEISPFGNVHTSPEFQRHLARVLTRKALKQAADRAGAKQ